MMPVINYLLDIVKPRLDKRCKQCYCRFVTRDTAQKVCDTCVGKALNNY